MSSALECNYIMPRGSLGSCRVRLELWILLFGCSLESDRFSTGFLYSNMIEQTCRLKHAGVL